MMIVLHDYALAICVAKSWQEDVNISYRVNNVPPSLISRLIFDLQTIESA